MQNVAASFTINPRHAIYTDFSINEEQSINTEFQIKADLVVKGEGLIDAVTTGNLVTITSTTYTHEQGVASDIWVINHDLNKHPSVTVVDTAGTVFTAQVEYNDENTCTVYINGATKGKAYLN